MTILAPFDALLNQAKQDMTTAITAIHANPTSKGAQRAGVPTIITPTDLVDAVMQGTLQAAALDLEALGYLAPPMAASEPHPVVIDGGELTPSSTTKDDPDESSC